MVRLPGACQSPLPTDPCAQSGLRGSPPQHCAESRARSARSTDWRRSQILGAGRWHRQRGHSLFDQPPEGGDLPWECGRWRRGSGGGAIQSKSGWS